MGRSCVVSPIEIVLHGDGARRAAWSWTDLGPAAIGPAGLDGVGVEDAPTDTPRSAPPSHPNLIDRVDHVVVATPDVGRTIDRYEEAGLELRRTRTIGEGEHRRTQAFFWAGDLILELVGPHSPEGVGPSEIWGISFESPDLDATVAALGPERSGSVRDAVQVGRRIATIRARELGISLPLAVMTPHTAPGAGKRA